MSLMMIDINDISRNTTAYYHTKIPTETPASSKSGVPLNYAENQTMLFHQ